MDAFTNGPALVDGKKLKSTRPLLRWAGSKRALLPELVARTPEKYGTYYEPFVGSARLFLEISPSRAVLGDINPGLIDTYSALKTRAGHIHQLLAQLPSNRNTYNTLRKTDPRTLPKIARAVRFLYLNRHCFNGVYRENKKGIFNVPYGSKIPSLPIKPAFTHASSLLRRADLRSMDFEDCLKDATTNDFVYLDPPYTKRGSRNRGEYGSGAFTAIDLKRFVACLHRLDRMGVYVLASFYDSRALRRQLASWHVEQISVARSVAGFHAKRRSAKELILTNFAR